MKTYTIEKYIPEEEIEKKIQEIADKINSDYEGREIMLIGILKGAAFFLCELAKRLTVPAVVDFISASSYGSGTVSSGNVIIRKDTDVSVTGKDVIIVEDIIDSGNTMSRLVRMIRERGPASLKVCALLDKPSRRVVKDFAPDYSGFTVEDAFLVGYGLDYDERYRTLPYIGQLSFDK